MTIVKKAIIKHLENAEPPQQLSLFRIEPKVYRWINDATGQQTRSLPVDYLTEDDALRALRVRIDGEAQWVGWDLTIIPVADPPEVRAAKRLPSVFTRDWDNDVPRAVDEAATIIRQETGIDKLVEAVNLLITYEMPRLREGKRPGLDMKHGGLIIEVLEALEKTQQVDLSNLKAKLAQGLETVKVYTNAPPPEGGAVQ